MDADQLRRYLEFYEDLGIKTLYRRAAPAGMTPAPAEQAAPAVAPGPADEALPAPQAADPGGAATPSRPPIAPPRPPDAPTLMPVSDILLPPLEPENDTLPKILEDIGDCRRCRLHEGRTKLVFGVGNEKSPLVFVGEGPGADEDAQGVPFVGRAGQLLTQMIEGTAKREGMNLLRADIYICNVVKCRPPGNRTPEPDEMEICGQFLSRQLSVIKPKALCALGGTAARALTGHKEGVTKMRGKWFQWRDIPVMVTYHPSFLLRAYNQAAKREAWEDLKKVLHFVYD
jgi:DNA polymerase